MDEEDLAILNGAGLPVEDVVTAPVAGSAATTGSSETNATASASPSGSGSVFGLPMKDYLFDQGITVDPIQPGAGLKAVGLVANGKFIVNDHDAGSPSILINSGRVIINSKESQTIIAGAQGVALTSPTKVNIDADESVTIFGDTGVYLGIPGKGQPPKPTTIVPGDEKFFKDGKKLKSYPSADVPYEPMVLGLKLINWLEDLLIILKYQQNLTAVGYSTARQDTQWDFMAMQTRLQELISTEVFVDGYSHEMPDFDSLPKPPKDDGIEITRPQMSIDVNVNASISNPLTTPSVPAGPNVAKPGYYESAGPPAPALN
jgi:hypothetical protein